MSPVGSYETLMAAIQGGADAVYFGIGHLNMRSKSTNNFTTEDLKNIVGICTENNVKTYLTVNTVIYDKDMESMKMVVDAAKTNNVTAIIASDISVLNYAFEKGVEVHASTQLNISNIEAVRFFSRFCDVMVMARELNLDQIRNISLKIREENICGPMGKPVKIEMFVHGALCMAVSGKCYLSLHEKDHSANRGKCLQTCRKSYIVTEKESGNELEIDHEYIMSPKDLKTIHFINKILDAGVEVLKIEGRARSAEYVKTVTRCYDEAIRSVEDGSYSDEKIAEWDQQLSKVFNRGFWDGYYLGQKMGEWSSKYGSVATTRKIYAAKCTNYFSNLKVAEFLVETGSVNMGDRISINGPTTGVVELTINEIRVDDKKVASAEKGKKFSISVDTLLRRSDKLYIIAEIPNNEK